MVMRSGSGRTRSTASPPRISGRMCLVTLGSELLACSPHVPIGTLLAYRHHAICGRTKIEASPSGLLVGASRVVPDGGGADEQCGTLPGRYSRPRRPLRAAGGWGGLAARP